MNHSSRENSRGSTRILAAMMPDAPPPLEGYLQKKGDKGLVLTYQKRYFAQRGNKLDYFAEKGDVSPKGSIDLSDVTYVRLAPDQKKGATYFHIITPHRVYYLNAPDEKEAKYWIEGLNKFLKLEETTESALAQQMEDMESVRMAAEQTNHRYSTHKVLWQQMQGEMEREIVSLNSQLQEKSSIIDRYKDIESETKAANDKVIEVLQSTLAQRDKEKKELDAQLLELQKEVAEKDASAGTILRDVARLKAELAETVKRLSDTESELKISTELLQKEQTERQIEIAKHEAAASLLSSGEEDIEQLREKLGASQAELAVLAHRCSVAEEENTSTKERTANELARLQEQVRQLELDTRKLREERDEAREGYMQQQSEAEKVRLEIQVLKENHGAELGQQKQLASELLASKNEEIQQLRSEREGELKSLHEAQAAMLSKSAADLQAVSVRFQEENRAALKHQAAELDKERSATAEANDRAKSFEIESVRASQEAESLRSQLLQVSKTLESLQSKHDAITKSLSAAEEANIILRQDIKHITAQLADSKQQYDELNRALVSADHEGEVKANRADQLHQRVLELEIALSREKKASQELQVEIDNKISEAEKLYQQGRDTQDKLEQERREIQEELAVVRLELQQNSERSNSELIRQQEVLRKMKDEHELEKVSLQQQLDSAKEAVNLYSKQLGEMEKGHEGASSVLLQEVEALREEIAKAKESTLIAQQETRRMQDACETAEVTIREQNEALSRSEHGLSEQREQSIQEKEATEKQLHQLQEELESLKLEIEEKDTTITLSNIEKQAIEAMLQERDDELGEQEEETSRLEEALNKCQAEKAISDRHLHQLKYHYVLQRNELEKTTALYKSKDAELSAVLKSVEELGESMGSKESNLLLVQSQMDELKGKIETMCQDIASKEKEKEAVDASLKLREEELGVVRNELRKSRQLSKSQQNDIEQLAADMRKNEQKIVDTEPKEKEEHEPLQQQEEARLREQLELVEGRWRTLSADSLLKAQEIDRQAQVIFNLDTRNLRLAQDADRLREEKIELANALAVMEANIGRLERASAGTELQMKAMHLALGKHLEQLKNRMDNLQESQEQEEAHRMLRSDSSRGESESEGDHAREVELREVLARDHTKVVDMKRKLAAFKQELAVKSEELVLAEQALAAERRRGQEKAKEREKEHEVDEGRMVHELEDVRQALFHSMAMSVKLDLAYSGKKCNLNIGTLYERCQAAGIYDFRVWNKWIYSQLGN